MAERFLFHVATTTDPTLLASGINGHWLAIVPESHWRAEGCLSDWHTAEDIAGALGADAVEGLGEEAESLYSFEDPALTRDALVAEMARRGFLQDAAFSAFMEETACGADD